MEVKLDKRYPVATSDDHAWAVLRDVRATAACMPGAQITEQLDDTHYKGTVRSKVGPAVMSFQGEIEVLALDSDARQLQMLGKGADKSGSSASMNLTARVEADGDGSVLVGQAVITVAGKLAQFGSRLLVPVSDVMLSQFADNFRAAAKVAAEAATSAPLPAPAASAIAPAPSETPAGAAGSVPAPAPTPAPTTVAPPPTHAELNALSLMWLVVKRWFAGLFGRGQ